MWKVIALADDVATTPYHNIDGNVRFISMEIKDTNHPTDSSAAASLIRFLSRGPILSFVLALAIIAFLAMSLLKPLASYDTGWNIRMGEWIWENGSLPEQDPLLYTSTIPTPDLPFPGRNITERQETKEWVLKTHWLGQLLFYGAWSVHETIGPVALRTLLYGLSVFGIVWTLRSLKLPWPWSLSGALVGMHLLETLVMARPSLFSIALVALSMALWVRLWVTGRPGYAWLAAALLPLWAQLHAGFVYGVALALGWIFCLTAERLLGQTVISGNAVWQRSPELAAKVPLGYLQLALLAVFAVVVPFLAYLPGLAGFVGLFRDMASMPVPSMEMAPIGLGDYPLYTALLVGVVLVAITRWHYLPLPMWAALLATAAAPLLAQRNLALFATVGLPVLLWGFQQLVESWKRIRTSFRGRFGIRLGLGLLLVAFVAEMSRTQSTNQPFMWESLRFPVTIAQFVSTHTPPGQPMHPYSLGGYLELAVPKVKWFADGRYYKPRLIAYATLANEDHDARRMLADYYHVDWMIQPLFNISNQKLFPGFIHLAADPEWIPITVSDNFALFVRKGERTAGYLAEHAMPYKSWHDALIKHMTALGSVMAAGEPYQEPWLALFLTLAGYIGAEGPNPDIVAPESLLSNVSPQMPAYRMSQEVLEILPVFQQQVAATLAQLPGGEAYAAMAGSEKTQTTRARNEE